MLLVLFELSLEAAGVPMAKSIEFLFRAKKKVKLSVTVAWVGIDL